jgi:hypothetical protein
MWMHTDKDYSRTIHHPLDVNGTSGRIINIADVMATPLKFKLTQAVTLLSICPELLQVRGWNISVQAMERCICTAPIWRIRAEGLTSYGR